MNPTQPGKIFWLIVLVAGWAFYGLSGRDAWQAEEARAFAFVQEQMQGRISSLLTPAPLFTALAALTANLPAQLGLSSHSIQDGVRWASGLFTLSTLLTLALSARGLLGIGFAPAVVLALLGCLGFMLPAHALIPETALLSMWALFFWGMGLARSHALLAGSVLTLGLCGLTLGPRGLPDLLAGVLILGLALLSSAWRNLTYLRSLGIALMATASLLAATAFHLFTTGQWAAWWQLHGLHPATMRVHAFADLAWLAWPLWLLAIAAVWHDHRRLQRVPELHLPLIALSVLLLAAVFPAWSRLGALLPVLLPLALLSAYAMAHLRRGSAQAFYWFGVVCFAFFIVLFWTYFAAIELGLPSRLAAHVARLTPAYQRGSVPPSAVWLAACATGLWLLAVPLFPRAHTRPILVWASGMALVWVLVIALFRPWAEAGWGYRPTLMALARHLPPGACVEIRVDAGMAAMLRYHLPQHRFTSPGSGCTWRLVGHAPTGQADMPAPVAGQPPDRWETVWEGARPRYKKQSYRLEHRHATHGK